MTGTAGTPGAIPGMYIWKKSGSLRKGNEGCQMKQVETHCCAGKPGYGKNGAPYGLNIAACICICRSCSGAGFGISLAFTDVFIVFWK